MKESHNKHLQITVNLLLCLLIVNFFLATGCDKLKKAKYDIYENSDISACGVYDPLQNIDWLREFCINLKKIQDYTSVYIHLYKVIDNDEHIFRVSIPSPIEYAPNQYYSTLYFRDCGGDTIFTWETMTPPGGQYEVFLNDKEYVTELFHFVKQ